MHGRRSQLSAKRLGLVLGGCIITSFSAPARATLVYYDLPSLAYLSDAIVSSVPEHPERCGGRARYRVDQSFVGPISTGETIEIEQPPACAPRASRVLLFLRRGEATSRRRRAPRWTLLNSGYRVVIDNGVYRPLQPVNPGGFTLLPQSPHDDACLGASVPATPESWSHFVRRLWVAIYRARIARIALSIRAGSLRSLVVLGLLPEPWDGRAVSPTPPFFDGATDAIALAALESFDASHDLNSFLAVFARAPGQQISGHFGIDELAAVARDRGRPLAHRVIALIEISNAETIVQATVLEPLLHDEDANIRNAACVALSESARLANLVPPACLNPNQGASPHP